MWYNADYDTNTENLLFKKKLSVLAKKIVLVTLQMLGVH